MKYALIRALLATHPPADAKEQTDIAHIRVLLDRYDGLLARTCSIGHVTGSSIVVDAQSGRVLLLFHRKLQRWLQPGGHGDNEDDPALIALREAQEETQLPDLVFYAADGRPCLLDVDVHAIPAHKGEGAHEHLDFRYLLVTNRPDCLDPAVREIRDARWLPIADAMELPIDGSLRRLLRKVQLCDISLYRATAGDLH